MAYSLRDKVERTLTQVNALAGEMVGCVVRGKILARQPSDWARRLRQIADQLEGKDT